MEAGLGRGKRSSGKAKFFSIAIRDGETPGNRLRSALAYGRRYWLRSKSSVAKTIRDRKHRPNHMRISQNSYSRAVRYANRIALERSALASSTSRGQSKSAERPQDERRNGRRDRQIESSDEERNRRLPAPVSGVGKDAQEKFLGSKVQSEQRNVQGETAIIGAISTSERPQNATGWQESPKSPLSNGAGEDPSRLANDSRKELSKFVKTLLAMVGSFRRMDFHNEEKSAIEMQMQLLSEQNEATSSDETLEQAIARFLTGIEKADRQLEIEHILLEEQEPALYDAVGWPKPDQVNVEHVRNLFRNADNTFIRQLVTCRVCLQADRQRRQRSDELDNQLRVHEAAIREVDAAYQKDLSDQGTPWYFLVTLEHAADRARNSRTLCLEERTALQVELDEAPVQRRARLWRLCVLIQDALVAAGFLPVEDVLKLHGHQLDNLRAEANAIAVRREEKADQRDNVKIAKQTLEAAQWKFDDVRKTYDERLAGFEAALASGRQTGFASRTEFDQDYFKRRNTANQQLVEAEADFVDYLMDARLGGAVPTDWSGVTQESGFPEPGSLAYGASRAARKIAAVAGNDRINDWSGIYAKGQPEEQDPESRESLSPEDDPARPRYAAGKYRARIDRWNEQRQRLGDPSDLRKGTFGLSLGGHAFPKVDGTWI